MRDQGSELPIIGVVQSGPFDMRHRKDAAVFFNQEVTRQFEAAKARAEAADELLTAATPWKPIVSLRGIVALDNAGVRLETKEAFFPLPFLETNKGGYIFEKYKSRFARHVLNLSIKMGVAVGCFKPEFPASLYLCGGTPK
jgi:hypothetical protein